MKYCLLNQIANEIQGDFIENMRESLTEELDVFTKKEMTYLKNEKIDIEKAEERLDRIIKKISMEDELKGELNKAVNDLIFQTMIKSEVEMRRHFRVGFKSATRLLFDCIRNNK